MYNSDDLVRPKPGLSNAPCWWATAMSNLLKESVFLDDQYQSGWFSNPCI